MRSAEKYFMTKDPTENTSRLMENVFLFVLLPIVARNSWITQSLKGISLFTLVKNHTNVINVAKGFLLILIWEPT